MAEIFSELTQYNIYLGCAVFGGAVLLLQTALMLFGIGGVDADFDGDAEFEGSDSSFGFLSVRAMTAFLTFFGLTGIYGLDRGWGTFSTAMASVLAGLALMALVAVAFRQLSKLQSSGNLEPEQAIGKTASVYLRIPAARSGQGKISLPLAGRSAEFTAVTTGPEIPTGEAVRVLKQTAPGVFEVERLED